MMKRNLISVLLALVLTLALLPTAALAEGETWTEINQDYVDQRTNPIILNGNYQLTSNVSCSSIQIIGTATLDLNGNTLTCSSTQTSKDPPFVRIVTDSTLNSTLTLLDSSAGKTGKIISAGERPVLRIGENSTLYAHGGTVEGTVVNYGSILVEAGETGTAFYGEVTNGDYNIRSSIISGGTFYGTVKNLWYNTISGGTFNGIVENGSKAIISGGVFNDVVRNPYGQNIQGTFNAGIITDNGSGEALYLISTAEGLKWFRDYVNSGTSENAHYKAWAKLTDDIVLDSSEAWTPIGNYTVKNQIFYQGTFDGNGHTISGLNVSDNIIYAGLFGVVTGGTIKNLAVAGNISPSSSLSSEAVGGIVGYASNAVIENCSNHCDISTSYVGGGIAGFNASGANIIDCYNVGTINVTNFHEGVGGIVGYNNGTVSNCYNVGMVSGDIVGEIVGDNLGTVENCYYLDSTNLNAVGTNHPSGHVTKTESKSAAQFADGTVRDLLYAGRKYDAQPWDSTCRLVKESGKYLPVFKYQDSYEPTPEPVSEPSGSRFSYSTVSASAGENGTISPSGDLSVRSDLGQTFTFTPDKGYRVADVLVNGKSVGALRSYTFATVRKDQTIEVIFEKIPAFVDVPANAYYAEAVNWALENWITEGTSDTLFSPDAPCTRAQAVTFLWRAAGCPAPSSYKMPFTDVKSDSYYYQAVLWAIENGIAQGTSETTFEPDAICTRAQIVCFLFRFKAANGMDAVTLAELLGGFADSAEIPAYARPALNWALSANVLQGSGAKLLPNDACTRAQIVAFLYRTMQ